MSPEGYALLREVHRACAALSVAGFALRFAAAMAGAAWVRRRPARTLPHVVDSVLLGTALAMAAGIGLSPAQAPWLLTKIALLLAYIGLGFVALRPSFARPLRLAAGLGALAVVGHIVAVAYLKHPMGLLHGAG